MKRHEWKSMHRQLRLDARNFKNLHGGFPCMIREVSHKGTIWTIRRVDRDGKGFRTIIGPMLFAARAIKGQIADEIDSAAGHHRALRRAPWTATTHKRGLRIAREIRLENGRMFKLPA